MQWTTYFALMLMMAASHPPSPPVFNNLDFFPVDHPEFKGFVTIEENCFEYQLFYVSQDNNLNIITPMPNGLEAGGIGYVFLSKDKEKVAIISYAEGHPLMSIYWIADLIHYRNNYDVQNSDTEVEGDKAVDCLAYLDPYPGCFTEVTWIDSHTIQFASDAVDLRNFSKEERRGKPMRNRFGDYRNDVRTWRWDFTNYSITLVKKKKLAVHEKWFKKFLWKREK